MQCYSGNGQHLDQFRDTRTIFWLEGKSSGIRSTRNAACSLTLDLRKHVIPSYARPRHGRMNCAPTPLVQPTAPSHSDREYSGGARNFSSAAADTSCERIVTTLEASRHTGALRGGRALTQFQFANSVSVMEAGQCQNRTNPRAQAYCAAGYRGGALSAARWRQHRWLRHTPCWATHCRCCRVRPSRATRRRSTRSRCRSATCCAVPASA